MLFRVRQAWVAGCLALGCCCAHAQGCAGGLFLNPEVVRGELAAQSDAAVRELVEFLKPSGLPVNPVSNVRDEADVARALKQPQPPCWVYGNPVVGLASGFRPAIVNQDPIAAAVLVVGDEGAAKGSKPVELRSLPAAEQARVLERLHKTECFGVKGGVTTALVKADKLCGTMTELSPSQGLGQSFLVVKAAFAWRPDRWIGLVTRQQSALAATMEGKAGSDPRIINARLIVVPAAHTSWGYGLYVSEGVTAETVRRAQRQFDALAGARPALLKALDVGAKARFDTPSAADVQAMRAAIQAPAR
jgi:hypothetical protein